MSDSANIARHLPRMAARQPHAPALKVPCGRTFRGEINYLTLTFAGLDAEADAWAAHFAARGVRRGDRVLMMVRQGLPLIAAAFALFKLGAVPVVIDPGMGLKSFLACVARSRPRVLLGLPFAQLVSRLFSTPFRSVEVRVGIAGRMTARAPSGAKNKKPPPAMADSAAGELAAVLFTSGSTGPPKGVRYEHGMFEAQVRIIRETYGIEAGEIDLTMLPIFALFNPALGMTTVVPEFNPGRPAAVDPAKIVQAIRQEGVTNAFGSPTLWRKIAAHCHASRLVLPSLRRVLMAGAPVPAQLFSDLRRLLPNGEAHSPYGATEALPVSTISATEVVNRETGTVTLTRRGAGTCVGRPVAGVEVKIIAFTDAPTPPPACLGQDRNGKVRGLPSGEIGEIVVRGPSVTREYDALPDATAAAKIPAVSGADIPSGNAPSAPDASEPCAESPLPSDTVWHRTGDAGYLDATGRLWFCGRKAERVETAGGMLFTEQCEPLFTAYPKVARCALIGLGPPGAQRPALVVEPVNRAAVKTGLQRREFIRALRSLAVAQPHTASIEQFFFHRRFPVDVRHNAKIHRLALARWAATQKPYGSGVRK